MTNTCEVFDAATPGDYLADDEFIQASDRAVGALARELRQRAGGDVPFAKAAFEWVRDQIGHSYDVSDPRVTLTAREVLKHRVGLCYAKSHLFAALLRSEGIPPTSLTSALSTARGTSWQVDESLGEIDYPQIFTSRARCVIDTLRGATDVLALYDTGLPTQLPKWDGQGEAPPCSDDGARQGR